uniref:Uncharacterized protein n=1 Tax=Populus trichocarpa TaxID=3694 RepID=A0A2K1XWN5_POPTR
METSFCLLKLAREGERSGESKKKKYECVKIYCGEMHIILIKHFLFESLLFGILWTLTWKLLLHVKVKILKMKLWYVLYIYRLLC